MKILAIDTSAAEASVALLVEDAVVGEVRLALGGGHSKSLLPAIELLLRTAAVPTAALDAVAGVTGPGAFTGLRVGLATLQGLALAADRPCVGVSSLEALAEATLGVAPRIVALVDGFRSDVFAQSFDGATGVSLGPPVTTNPADAASGFDGEVAFVGSGAIRYRNDLTIVCPSALFPPLERFLAPLVARIGARRVLAGATVPPEALRPLYIRPPDIRPSTP